MYKKRSKKLTIIDESYNSNPLSMRFALERYESMQIKRSKKFLLIGNMLELGKHSKKLHKDRLVALENYIKSLWAKKSYS